jgi:CHAT domain-containing protein/Tfp pilus assembly protein PilF
MILKALHKGFSSSLSFLPIVIGIYTGTCSNPSFMSAATAQIISQGSSENNAKAKSSDADIFQKNGNDLQKKGEFNSALQSFQRALKLNEEQNDRAGQAQSLNSVASVYNELGQFVRAIESYERALKISKDSKDALGESGILNNMGIVYRNLGQFDRAIKLYQEALKIQQKLGDRFGIARTINNLGLVYRNNKEYANALDYYRQALALTKESGKNPAGEAVIHNNIGFLLNERGLNAEAFKSYQQSLEISQKLADRVNESVTLGNIGLLYNSQGQFDVALGYYQQALAVSRQTGDRAGEAKLYQHIGTLLKERKQNVLAIAYLKQSVNTYEEIRKDLNSLARQEQKLYADTIAPVYRRLADLLLQQDRVIEAQQVLDLLKVQEVDDYLKNVRGNEQTAKGVEYQPVERQMIALNIELADLQVLESQGKLTLPQKERLTVLVNQEKEANRQFSAFLNSAEVQKLTTELNNDIQQQNVNLKAVVGLQKELKQLNAVIIYPLVLESRLEIVLITPSSPPIHRTVQIRQRDISAAVEKFRANLIDSSNFDFKETSQQFYKWLIEPIAAELQQANVQTIIYAPDSRLRYIPISTLYDGKQFLVEKYNINNITASSLTNFNRREVNQPKILAGASTIAHSVTVLGKPISFGAIPATKQEVKNIVKIFPNVLELVDSSFTKSTTRTGSDSHNIIHLATHGSFNTGTPDESFLIFGDSDRLTLKEIDTWVLKGVDLVVLSACETGIGGKYGDGTEVLGLGYQFQHVGARAVIASLWTVSDGGTQKLMDAFYANLKKGVSATESLRLAQITMIRGGEPFDHPYFWSAFFLIGNGL